MQYECIFDYSINNYSFNNPYMVGNFFLNRRAVTELDQNEFHKGLRKAQVIDVREKVDYDYGHINGARNIPISMFRQRFQGLRKRSTCISL